MLNQYKENCTQRFSTLYSIKWTWLHNNWRLTCSSWNMYISQSNILKINELMNIIYMVLPPKQFARQDSFQTFCSSFLWWCKIELHIFPDNTILFIIIISTSFVVWCYHARCFGVEETITIIIIKQTHGRMKDRMLCSSTIFLLKKHPLILDTEGSICVAAVKLLAHL